MNYLETSEIGYRQEIRSAIHEKGIFLGVIWENVRVPSPFLKSYFGKRYKNDLNDKQIKWKKKHKGIENTRKKSSEPNFILRSEGLLTDKIFKSTMPLDALKPINEETYP